MGGHFGGRGRGVGGGKTLNGKTADKKMIEMCTSTWWREWL